MTGEDDEAWPAVGADGPHHHQSFKAHVGARAGNTVRQEGEGVDGVEIIAVDCDRAVGDDRPSGTGNGAQAGTDLGRVLGQRLAHVGADAVDVDV